VNARALSGHFVKPLFLASATYLLIYFINIYSNADCSKRGRRTQAGYQDYDVIGFGKGFSGLTAEWNRPENCVFLEGTILRMDGPALWMGL
jgi:hypothetical protein